MLALGIDLVDLNSGNSEEKKRMLRETWMVEASFMSGHWAGGEMQAR